MVCVPWCVPVLAGVCVCVRKGGRVVGVREGAWLSRPLSWLSEKRDGVRDRFRDFFGALGS